MNKILLGQSYFLRFDPKLWEAMQPYPPLGTLYAASYLRQRGYQVSLFDAMLAESEHEWEAALDREQPDLAVIYEDNFNYLSKMCLLRMRQAAFKMAGMARERGLPVVAAGSDASDHPDLYLENGADYVLIGEGEHTLGELTDRLSEKSDTPLGEIQGLAYQDPAHSPSMVINPRRPDLKELDSLPFPAWDLVDTERYRHIWISRHGYYSMNMVTTRGCPFHCNWCAKPIWGQRYNVRSPENVVAEMKWLKRTYRPDHLWIVDDIMGLKLGWLPRFADLVAREHAGIPFKCLSRVDLLLREGEIEALTRAGAQIVWVGAESGSQKILDAMEKGTRVDQIYQATARLREAGVKIGFFLQFGYPGETRQDLELTLQMVRDLMPDDLGMSVSYPLPGTKFHARVKDQLGMKQNWRDSQDLAMLYHGTYSTAFYRHLHTVLHKEFRMRKNLSQIRRALRSSSKGRGLGLEALLKTAYYAISLPLDRRRLKTLADQSDSGLPPLPPGMNQRAAATPSPQPES